jgi:hypothetical protein
VTPRSAVEKSAVVPAREVVTTATQLAWPVQLTDESPVPVRWEDSSTSWAFAGFTNHTKDAGTVVDCDPTTRQKSMPQLMAVGLRIRVECVTSPKDFHA